MDDARDWGRVGTGVQRTAVQCRREVDARAPFDRVCEWDAYGVCRWDEMTMVREAGRQAGKTENLF